ncbi:MAG: hydrogenase maturation protease, partial [Candidatus Marinimicrobia bacterium]|nr:hydrogenase maturation protease [Candidatus Neomarinimicrobiota bacterium]
MHSKEKKDVVFLGLGNLLMEDEGFGVHVYRYIEENYRFSPEIEMIDGGTAGFELLPFFEDYDKILMVDAVEFEKEPGFVGLIENDDILAQLTQKMSLHHLGISDVISTAQLLEYT